MKNILPIIILQTITFLMLLTVLIINTCAIEIEDYPDEAPPAVEQVDEPVVAEPEDYPDDPPQDCELDMPIYSGRIPWLTYDYYADGTLLLHDGIGVSVLGLNEHWMPWQIYEGTKTIIIDEGVEYIYGHAFTQFKNVETVVLPDTLTTIKSCAFMGCMNLKYINFPDSVKYIGAYSFLGCYRLMPTNIPVGCYVDDTAFMKAGIWATQNYKR